MDKMMRFVNPEKQRRAAAGAATRFGKDETIEV
jgi:hypothetical protein